MLYNEAQERFRKLFPDLIKDHAAQWVRRDAKPGEVEWVLDDPEQGAHQIDCNGHFLCHPVCMKREDALP